MGKRLANKICLLMGGGASSPEGGLSNGQAVAVTFAREGAAVAVIDQSLPAAQATVEMINEAGGRSIAWQADVSRHEEVRAAVAGCRQAFGRIDILYNNVGIEVRGGVVDMTEEAWDRVHAVNLKSVFLACKEVVPEMAQQGGGVILNVSSTASLRWTTVEYLSYSTSKAALNHLTRVLARQHASQRIRCNAILPGMIDTPHIRTLFRDKSEEEFAAIQANRHARCPMGRQGSCWDVANAALFLASDEASYISGVLLPVDGALSV